MIDKNKSSKFYKLSKLLYNARKNNNYTLKEVAHYSGISSSLISTLENCKTTSIPTQKTLVQLETVLGFCDEELQRIFDYVPKKSSHIDRSTEIMNSFGTEWKIEITNILKSLKFSKDNITEIINFIQIRLYQNIDEPWMHIPLKLPEEAKLEIMLKIQKSPNSFLKKLLEPKAKIKTKSK